MSFYKQRISTFLILFIFINIFYPNCCDAQIITSVAGYNVFGYSGDGGPATAAKSGDAYGVATDNAGNFYFSSMTHNMVRKVDVNGIITTFAGTGVIGLTGDGGLATAARLYHPSGISTDNLGNVYIIDQNADVIRKVNSAGIITTIAGRTDRSGYSPDGTPAVSAYLPGITYVKPDNLGNLYISERYNCLVRKINAAGILSTIAGKPVVAGSGSSGGFSGDGGPAINAEIKFPWGIEIDRNGNLYIADAGNRRIRKINTSGIISTIAGNGGLAYNGDGGSALNAQFGPYGMAIDNSNNLYFADQVNHRIRKIDNAGIITTIAGNGTRGYSGDGGPAVSAQINEPWGVALDNAGNLLISDGSGGAAIIRKVTLCFQVAITTGTSNLCIGANTTLSNASAGGTWSTNNPSVATVDANGKIIGVSAGTAIIGYTITSGICTVTAPFPVTVNAVPSTVSITGNQTVCLNDAITLNSSITSGTWSSSNTNIASIDATGKVTGILPGNTTINYQLTNACGSSQATKLITVNPIPTVQPINGATQVCAGSTITLNNPTYGGVWSATNIAIATINPIGVLTGLAAGVTSIKYEVINAGCVASSSLTVTVNALPVLQSLTGSSLLCLNSSTQLNNATTGGIWSSANPTIIKTDQNGFITGASVGSASINYTFTSPGCGAVSTSKMITVSPLPDVKYNLPSICLPNGQGYFDNLSTIPDGSDLLLSYRWDFGDASDPTSSTLKTPIHKYSSTGPYFVKLLVTSKDGCKDSLTQKLTSIYPQPKANFQVSASEICLDQQLAFTDISNSMGFPISSYHWGFARGDSSFLQNPVHSFHDSGMISTSLYIINSQGCVSDTAAKQILVHPYPKLIMENVQGVLQGGTISIQPKYYYGSGLTFLWSPSTYLDSTTIVAPHSSPQENITYKLTLTGVGGCSITDSITVSVLKAPVIPNAFSPNGDGINDKWKIQYLESYPDADIQVYNRNGQIIYRSKGYSTEWDGSFNGKPLPVATYYYVINPKNGRSVLSGSVTILK